MVRANGARKPPHRSAILTKANTRTIKSMGWALLPGRVATRIRDATTRMSGTASEKCIGRMARIIEVSGKMVSKMDSGL